MCQALNGCTNEDFEIAESKTDYLTTRLLSLYQKRVDNKYTIDTFAWQEAEFYITDN